MGLREICLGVALFFAAPAVAQTPDQLASVQRASNRGSELYEHDRAAWLATDAMFVEFPDPNAAGLRGWVTERTTDGIIVLFVRPDGAEPRGAFRAVYSGGRLTEQGRANTPLSEQQARLYRARQFAIQSDFDQCASRYNTVTLPRAARSDDGVDIDVYLMPGTTTAGELHFGGFYRMGVDSESNVIREIARFTNSCITMQVDESTAGVVVSQIIGDTPTEIHVFTSLSFRKPVHVNTRSGLWEVSGAQIRLVSGPPEPALATLASR
jgi:hypothetical protein